MRLLLLFLLFTATPVVRAHPVAQGRMELEVRGSKLAVRAEVSEEEVVVGTTLGRGAGTGTDDPWRAYADYLLAHVRFSAGGAALGGKVVGADRVLAPSGRVLEGRAVYRLEFDLPPDARELGVEQDCLNEILYAPGNPWTASYVLRVALPGRAPEDGLLLESNRPLSFTWNAGAAPSFGPAEVSAGRVWREYFLHGVRHILEGWDHLLFISALALAAVTFWDLVKVVTAFTLAHTLTLVLSVLNIVRLPSRVVEPMIALSIVFVALQNVVLPRASRGWWRWGAAFGFGLFHGLGFAGGLLEAMEQLPAMAVSVALASFSLGVEAGHQVVVIPVFFLALAARKWGGERGRMAALRWGSALVVVAGIYYVFAALRGA